jgi:thiol-disulfide isomerase/thioredoxin
LLPFILTACLAVAACDRPAEEVAQPKENSPAVKEVDAGIDRGQSGSQLPDVTVSDADGNTLSLRDLKGTPVLINLWATWCAPCVAELPTLDALAGQMDGKLRVLTVSQDLKGAEVVSPFFEKYGYANLQPWLDPENALGFGYDVDSGLPLTVLYDETGSEVWRYYGENDWTGEEAMTFIQEGLREQDKISAERIGQTTAMPMPSASTRSAPTLKGKPTE